MTSKGSDGGASVEGEGHRYRPWGFLGGSEGMPAKLDLMVPGHADRALPSKVGVPASMRCFSVECGAPIGIGLDGCTGEKA